MISRRQDNWCVILGSDFHSRFGGNLLEFKFGTMFAGIMYVLGTYSYIYIYLYDDVTKYR